MHNSFLKCRHPLQSGHTVSTPSILHTFPFEYQKHLYLQVLGGEIFQVRCLDLKEKPTNLSVRRSPISAMTIIYYAKNGPTKAVYKCKQLHNAMVTNRGYITLPFWYRSFKQSIHYYGVQFVYYNVSIAEYLKESLCAVLNNLLLLTPYLCSTSIY